MSKLLDKQVAIVTGGTAGIGKAIAMKFAAEGATVILFGSHAERGEIARAELQTALPDSIIRFMQVNVTDTARVSEAIQQVIAECGTVDVLVNNAGVTCDKLLMKMSENDWDSVMDVNAKSCYNTTHAVVRSMLKARKGKIINISSVVGLIGNPGQANYAASKAAIIGFTKALAKELASRNICVNCIAPGFIATQMTDALAESQKSSLLERIPLGRLGKVEEVAHLAYFLATSQSNYITGQVISVDGGMT
jgi:3-oxoacyl-[acyl-carrier protein] reductase